MKKILLFIAVLFTIYCQAQTIECKPNRITNLGNYTLDTVAGDQRVVYFRFTDPVHWYSIQIFVADTIEGVATGARLEGTNHNTSTEWKTVVTSPTITGDTIILAKDVAVFATPILWTGSQFPYALGRVRIPDYTITEGTIGIYVYYY